MSPRTEVMTASEMRERLIEKATTEDAFRAQLISDPKAAIQEEFGLKIPAEFNVVVHEDLADTAHLVLPPSAKLGEADLQQAAGGESTWDIIWRTLFD